MLEITPTILSYVVAGLILLVIGLVVALMKTNSRVSALLQGKDGKDLEDTMKTLITGINTLSERQDKNTSAIDILEKNIKSNISGVGIVRFNPFEGSSGSNQSFAVALIDDHGNGVIFSSLYSREKVSVFAKPVEKFNSSYKLTEEETKALGKARGL
jgi:hypothetical protein